MKATKRLEEMRQMISQYMNLYSRIEPTEESQAIAQTLNNLDDALVQASGETPNKARTSLQKSVGKGGKNQREDVRLVQQLLNNAGYQLTLDGWIGKQTISAIQQFQKSIFNGWADGLIDPGGKTWEQLNASQKDTDDTSTNPSNPSTPTGGLSAAVGKGVAGGNRPSDVLLVQQLLNKVKGGLSEDGQFGNNTSQAIHRYQRSIFKGWSDGKIDPDGNTWKALKAGKGSAAVVASSGNTGTGGNQVFRLGGQQIASIPSGAQGSLPLVVLFGGASYATPEWMLQQIPSNYFARALVYIVPQRTGFNAAKAAYSLFLPEKAYRLVP